MNVSNGLIGQVAKLVAGGVMMAALAAGLGGCNNDLKDQNAALTQENQELRDRNSQLESQLQTADTARSVADGMPTATYSTGRPSARRSSSPDDFGAGTQISRQGNDIVVTVAGDVLFDSGQATLKPTSKKTLDKVAAALKSKYSGNPVRIDGYTDTDPIRKSKFASNEALSAARAESVENYLISKGVPTSRLSIRAMGSSNPKPTKKDSRRVEIVVMDGGI
ncbi:MAG: OmpA family protein [Phycisphaeraceae bacterium]|nr:OmpA family protein [Phycisphaeraceae bacterium]